MLTQFSTRHSGIWAFFMLAWTAQRFKIFHAIIIMITNNFFHNRYLKTFETFSNYVPIQPFLGSTFSFLLESKDQNLRKSKNLIF